MIAAGRCLVALDETVVRLGGIFDTIDRAFDTASMRKLAGALRRRTLADTFTTPARVFAETARISFFLDKEGGRPLDDADDDENWTRWCERCARCVTSTDDDGAAAAQFLRMLSHACAKSPSYLAARVPVDVISSVSDAAAAGGSNETLENGPLGNPERVLLIAGALARFAAAGADVPAAKLAESAAAAAAVIEQRKIAKCSPLAALASVLGGCPRHVRDASRPSRGVPPERRGSAGAVGGAARRRSQVGRALRAL